MSDKKTKKNTKSKIKKIGKNKKIETFGTNIIKFAGAASEIAIPGASLVGNTASEAFSKLMGNYIGKNQEEILLDIVESLEKLKVEIDKIKDKDKFATTVLQILPISLRTNEREKREALKNIVLNTALGNNLDDDIHQFLLNQLDSITSWHIKILDYFKHPQGWFQVRQKTIPPISSGSAASALEEAFPKLKGKIEFYEMIIMDLQNRGLMQQGKYLHVNMTSSGVYSQRITDMGVSLLDLIKSP